MKKENKMILSLVMVFVLLCATTIRANLIQPAMRDKTLVIVQKNEPVLRSARVTITSYHAQKWQTKTADGSVITPGVMWCAISKDLMKSMDLQFGDTIYYNEVGYAVKDLTHNRLKNTVDILVHNREMILEKAMVYFK